MKTFCCFDSLLFYTIFIIIIVRSQSQQDNFNITNLPKEVRLSNYNITEVSRGPPEISHQEVILDNHQERTPNFQREMVELNPYGPFSRKYEQSNFQRSILNYFWIILFLQILLTMLTIWNINTNFKTTTIEKYPFKGRP